MELRHLRYFVVLAEELHFGRAAERLSVAQPAISQQTRALERDLGVRLLDRTTRTVRLTPEGEHLLERARRIVDDADSMRHFARRVARGQAGLLRIGAVPLATFNYLPGLLRTFLEGTDEVEVSMHVLDTNDQIDALIEDRLDVGFVRPWFAAPTLSRTDLRSDPVLLAVPDTHRLAERKDPVDITECAGNPFVTYARRTAEGYYNFLLDFCAAAGFQPTISHEASDIYTIVGLVGARLGIAVVPAETEHLRIPRVRYLRLANAPALTYCLAWKPDRLSATADRFVQLARTSTDLN